MHIKKTLASLFTVSLIIGSAPWPTMAQTNQTLIQDLPAIAVDGTDQSYVVWREYEPEGAMELKLQKFSRDGDRLWNLPKTLASSDQELTSFFALNTGKNNELLANWAVSNANNTEFQFFLQRYDSINGEQQWDQPLMYHKNSPEERFFLQLDMANPQTDSHGNSYVGWIERMNDTSQIYFQIYDHAQKPKWDRGIVIDERASPETHEFFFSDINTDPDTQNTFISYLEFNPSNSTEIIYHLALINFSGEVRWNDAFSLPVNDNFFPSIIYAPALSDEGTIHFGWAIQNKTTKLLTQHFMKMNDQGILLRKQHRDTTRTYSKNLRTTSIIAPNGGSTQFGIGLAQNLTIFQYEFSGSAAEQSLPLAESQRSLAHHSADKKLIDVNNWSVAVNKKGQTFVVWSEYEKGSSGAPKNSQLKIQKLNRNLIPLWGEGRDITAHSVINYGKLNQK